MRFQGVVGLLVLTGIAWIASENRRKVNYRAAIVGIAVQICIAVLLLYIPIFKKLFLVLNRLVLALDESTRAGTSFVFGYAGGGPAPFDVRYPGSGFILAFQALPLVLVIGALSSLFFYWRILPYIVRLFSMLLQRTLKIGGALALGASATIFLGMVESPLLIKPYLQQMTRSEMFSLMVCGMASIAGTVMVLYSTILAGVISDPLGNILTASLIHIAAAITISRIMVPEAGGQTGGSLLPPQTASGSMDAIVRGAMDAVRLLINIIAMLIVMVALVHLVNLVLGLLPVLSGRPVTLQLLLGYVMAPVVWLFGIPWSEAQAAGLLMGTKTMLNELLAFIDLANLPPETLSPRSRLIMTYALSSFANFGSLGILIGGFGSLVPERRTEIVGLGIKSLIAGTLATCMTGAVVGMILG